MGSKGRRFFVVAAAAAFAACSKSSYEPPPLDDAPVIEPARLGRIELLAPGYGISVSRDTGLDLEVNIEADDAPHVRAGQPCAAYIPPSTAAISCSVTRVLRGASAETGQAIAWLKPATRGGIASGEFVFAEVTMGVKNKALIVPVEAVLSKDGRSWVVRQKDGKFEPVEVSTGDASGGFVEVTAGLAEGDAVGVRGGLGFLYPEFKAAGD